MTCPQCHHHCLITLTITGRRGETEMCRDCWSAPMRGPTIVRAAAPRQQHNKPRQGSH